MTEYDWRHQAACLGADPEVFFAREASPEGRDHHTYPDEAQAYCRRCPVRAACLEFAVAAGEEHGVWGGLSEHARRNVAHARGIGRKPRTYNRYH